MSTKTPPPHPTPASQTVPAQAKTSTSLKAGSLGAVGIVLFVMSAQAPMTGIAGAGPLAIGLGNGPAAPAAYLLVGLVIVLFAVGFTAMNRRVRKSGAFYAYVSAGIGPRTGAGASWLALLAYSSIQAAMYGLFGVSTAGILTAVFGISVPWWIIVLVAIAFVLFLGTRSVEAGVRFVVILVVAEFAIILLFAGAVLLRGGGPDGLDLAASFSPAVFLQGAPGVAVMFAVASMFGFEQTAIYSAEAKDPVKTVARATYASVAIIALFFAFVIWILVSFYGHTRVVDAAFAALGSEDPTQFLLHPMSELLGPWAGLVGQILLATSLLIGIIAFHNSVNRYLHALGAAGSLPAALARTNRHSAPQTAALVQTALALLVTAPFMLLGLDPVLTLFSWFSGLAVAALLTLYVLASIGITRYLRRETEPISLWRSTIAPSAAAIGFAAFLYLVVANFVDLTGSSMATAIVLLLVVPFVFVIGVLVDARARSRRRD